MNQLMAALSGLGAYPGRLAAQQAPVGYFFPSYLHPLFRAAGQAQCYEGHWYQYAEMLRRQRYGQQRKVKHVESRDVTIMTAAGEEIAAAVKEVDDAVEAVKNAQDTAR